MKKLHFDDMSLRRKIILIALAGISISLLMAGTALILNERLTFPRLMEQNLSNLAQIIGDNSTAALSFNDNKTAQEVLNTLKANPHIQSAILYDGKGEAVAQYPAAQDGLRPPPLAAPREGASYDGGMVESYHYVLSGKERLGTLYLRSDTGEMKSRLNSYTFVMAVVWVFSSLIAYWVVLGLQKRVTEPLRHVVDRMKDIAKGEGDLTKRLQVYGKDEIGQVAESFNTYVDKLQSVDEMKLGLISVVSHQLKTPVAEINGYIENILEGVAGPVSAKQKQYLEDMKEIGLENYRLICDLLNVSKIERGVVSVNLKPVSARRLVELSIRDYQEIIRRKGLQLLLEGLNLDFEVYADQDKTVETIRNVINNAVKCTDEGSLTVAIGKEEGRGVIEVRDTGIGMSQEILEKLFTKSRVLGKEAGRAGAGLGLYIAKHFMKLQKGDILVSSEMGKGSVFKLVIPIFEEPEGVKA